MFNHSIKNSADAYKTNKCTKLNWHKSLTTILKHNKVYMLPNNKALLYCLG